MANPVPHQGIFAYQCCDYKKELAFLRATFGSVEETCALRCGPMVVHAELNVKNVGHLFLCDSEAATHKAPRPLYAYVKDADAVYKKALKAGATSKTAPVTMFWGDRTATVMDPAGVEWSFLTQVEKLSGAEMQRRMDATMNGPPQSAAAAATDKKKKAAGGNKRGAKAKAAKTAPRAAPKKGKGKKK